MILPGLAELWPLALLLLAIGLAAGFVAGLLGVGGGFLLVPAFLFCFGALGYDGPQIMQICLATSLATIVFTAARAVAAQHRRGAVDWAILRGWAPGIAAGAVAGVLVADRLDTRSLMLIFGVLGTAAGLHLALGGVTARPGASMPRGPVRAGLAALIGLVAVLLGIGGALMGVPLMRRNGIAIHRAVATASGFGLVVAVPAVTVALGRGWGTPLRPPLTLGLVNLPAMGMVIATTLIAAPFGVRAAHALDPVLLRRLFAGFVLVMALNMLRLAWVA